MNQKYEITNKVLNTLNPDATEKDFKVAYTNWWANIRNKDKGGLRLTEFGYKSFKQADLKDYRVAFDQNILFTNRMIIQLDHFIDCPYYLTHKEIFVFSEKMAVQLVLFSGDIKKYGQARETSQDY
jgi:hypothetical protein